MSKKKKVYKTNLQKVPHFQQGQQPAKSTVLIVGGVLLAMSSIGLLIFVLSNKIFHLS